MGSEMCIRDRPYVSAIENEYDNLLILKVKKEAWNVDKDVTLLFTYVHPVDSPFY